MKPESLPMLAALVMLMTTALAEPVLGRFDDGMDGWIPTTHAH